MQQPELNEIFELAYRFVTETNENIFLTGKAGTGKTTFLKYLTKNCAKNIIIAAPTGVAAINAGGVTLHSLFQLPFHPFLPTAGSRQQLLGRVRYNRQRQQLLRKMDLLIIDEISMVRCDVLDAIDTILRSIRRNHQLPFGGVQLLYIGDLFQLPPVTQAAEWSIMNEYYDSAFFFDSHVIKEQSPLLIELDKIYRQKDDSFVRLLNKVRSNTMDADDFEDLNMRHVPGFLPDRDDKYITLTTHNNQADQINQQQLYRLNTPAFTYQAVIEKDFPENMYPAEAGLELKEGAQVMFLKNDVRKRYFNGKIGEVKLLEKDRIIVESEGLDIEVGRETWENSRYSLNRSDGKLEQDVVGSFTQYPLRLAWAITIHKSQGLTFDNVIIDAAAAFSSGQVYVALSRCTSLEGIVLLNKIPATAILNNEQVNKGQQSLVYRGSLPDRFAAARLLYTQQILEEIFSFSAISHDLLELQQLVFREKLKLNNGAVDWMDELRNKIEQDRAVGQKFLSLALQMIKEEPVIENNSALQKRISDAANHFLPRFEEYLSLVKNQPLVTELRELALDLNDALLLLAQSLISSIYQLGFCREPFSLTGFLRHKLNFALPHFAIETYAGRKKQDTGGIDNPELFDTLKRWRDLTCKELDLPIYMVLNQTALKEIASYLPMSKKDLLLLTGFGKAKVEKYGDEILEAVESYCSRHQLTTNMAALEGSSKKAKEPKPKAVKTDSKKLTLELFEAGKTISEIAAERKLSSGTIESHLIHFIKEGVLDIDKLVPATIRQLIETKIEELETESLTVIKENLPEEISYSQLHMVKAFIKRNAGTA